MKINKTVAMIGVIIVVIVALSLMFITSSEKPVTVTESINTVKSGNVESVNRENEATSKFATSSNIAPNITLDPGVIIVGEVAEYVGIARARAKQFTELPGDAEAETHIKDGTIMVRFRMSPRVERETYGTVGNPIYLKSIVIDIKTKTVVRDPWNDKRSVEL